MRRRMRGDWIYRGVEFDDEGGAAGTQVASYTGVSRNSGAYPLAPGTDVGIILYDSANYMLERTRTGPFNIGREARAEGRGATILAVQGYYYMLPNAWTAGSNWCVSARIIIADQNLQTGQMDLPANYQLPATSGPGVELTAWANGWGNLAERTDWNAFATGNEQQRWKFGLRWRGRRRLKPHECLGILIQSAGPAIGSTSMTLSPLFRTLVSDPNS